MRYSAEHKRGVRQQIVQASASLAKEQGFAATGVDALMGAAGLTSGGFYRHFDSKDELLRAIVESEMARSTALFESAGTRDAFERILSLYLDPAHVAHPDRGCILPALTPEIARAPDDTRAAFGDALQGLHERITDLGVAPDRAWALLSMAVGAVMLARACQQPRLQQDLLQACLQSASEG